MFFFQAEDGIRDIGVTGVQTCALPISFIGGRMIRESFLPEEAKHFDPVSLKSQLFLAVATSIDALAIGITFAFTGYRTLGSLTLPLVIIGLVSFFFSLTGNLFGIRFGG